MQKLLREEKKKGGVSCLEKGSHRDWEKLENNFHGKAMQCVKFTGMPFFLLFPDFRIFHQSSVKVNFSFLFFK